MHSEIIHGACLVIRHFRYIKIELHSEAQRTQTFISLFLIQKKCNSLSCKQLESQSWCGKPSKKQTKVSFNVLCWCPLSLTAKLYLKISKTIYKQGFWQVAEKKVKFRGIFRDKFAEKTADFAGISREFSRPVSLKNDW